MQKRTIKDVIDEIRERKTLDEERWNYLNRQIRKDKNRAYAFSGFTILMALPIMGLIELVIIISVSLYLIKIIVLDSDPIWASYIYLVNLGEEGTGCVKSVETFAWPKTIASYLEVDCSYQVEKKEYSGSCKAFLKYIRIKPHANEMISIVYAPRNPSEFLYLDKKLNEIFTITKN